MTTLTLANQLTLLRLFLVPALVILVLYGHNTWALAVFALAGATDVLDGVIARRSRQQTNLGALLDPMADKLLFLSMFVVLSLPGLELVNRIPVWLTVLVISRDVVIVLTVAIFNLAVERRTFQPSVLGKLTTAVYVVTGVVTLWFNALGRPSALVGACVFVSAGFTLVSGLHYLFHVQRDLEGH
jgi:cardiolipin synthase